MALPIKLFSQTSASAQVPSTTVTVDPGYKILGGGAVDNYTEPGNMLTASYPLSLTQWFAAGKNQEVPSAATVTAYALALYDPNDDWDVIILSGTCAPAHHPAVVVYLDVVGYVMTGGGACVNYTGQGNILTASYPLYSDGDFSGWQAQSKDQDVSDPASITAYVIGISQHNKFLDEVQHSITVGYGAQAAHPSAQAVVESGYTLCGGGAIDNYTGDGNLLTASCPNDPGPGVQPTYWIGAGKDHLHSDPSTIAVWAIGIQLK